MSTLYMKIGCPYCNKVIPVLKKYEPTYTEKNIADENIADELIELGGKRQVPFLIDGDVQMYESDAIVAYIESKNGNLNTHIEKPSTSGVCSIS